MLTTMQIMSAAGVVAYFGRELSTSEYYTAEHGVWYGKGAERLGLPSDLTKEDFVAIANNRIPQSGDRLTARTNDKRTAHRMGTRRGDSEPGPEGKRG